MGSTTSTILYLRLVLLLLLTGWGSYAAAQVERPLKLLTVSYDNDFINFRGEGTDRYYTEGTLINEYYTKPRPKGFADKLLIPVKNASFNFYGWGILQKMYTPTDITKSQVIEGDRPYAGVLYASHSLQSFDSTQKIKLTTEWIAGVIGPWALGKEIQTAVHRLIHYKLPMGWGNQVANDAVINYNITAEKLLAAPADRVEVIGLLETDIGTLYDDAGCGLVLRAGKFVPYFTAPSPGRFQFYYYSKLTAKAVMSDATLEGGFFTHLQSPYVISPDDLERVYAQLEMGICLTFKKFSISGSQKFRTPQFKTANAQVVGNFTLAWWL